MIETIIYITIAVILGFWMRILDAMKSGCFYSVSRGDKENKFLKKKIANLHYIQTPLWYCQFGIIGILLFAVFRLIHPDIVWMNLLSAYLISQGTSSFASVFYQGYINVGSGLPFVDNNENKKMEFAIPFFNKTIWISRFWYGKRRVYISTFGGLAMIVAGILLAF